MPASNQPVETSVTCSASFRSTGLVQAEEAAASASRQNANSRERAGARVGETRLCIRGL